MEQNVVTFLPKGSSVCVEKGATLLQAQVKAGLHPDAPCGGKGTCGKCRVDLEGHSVLACQTLVDRDMTVSLSQSGDAHILADGITQSYKPDQQKGYAIAFDIGTTTIVVYLMDLEKNDRQVTSVSCLNPQTQYGADVVSRIEYAMNGGAEEIKVCVQKALSDLLEKATETIGISPGDITCAAIAGNTAMHHLLLGIDPKPLITPPYMPNVFQPLELPGKEILPIAGNLRILPNIAGFVGGDTVSGMLATRFDELEELTLMIDIGTNGEMVLGNRKRRIACSTAAGPAFEGAKISCGMRGAAGAVDHVWLEKGTVHYHVIDETEATGLCGSGLLDLIAVLLDIGIIDESGYLEGKTYKLEHTSVVLTQQDVREVQLAKAAIRAGIELLARELGVTLRQIRCVYLAGAFGNYMDPASACKIGMIPPALLHHIRPIGNAAGEGAKLCAVSRQEFLRSQTIAAETEFLELAGLPQFQDCYIDSLEFSEEAE